MMGLWNANIERWGLPHWFIIQTRRTGQFSLVHAFNVSDDRVEMYWRFGPGHCPFHNESFRVVWYLGQFDSDEKILDGVDLLIDQQYQMTTSGEFNSDGIISPDGDFYPVKYGEHTANSSIIVAHLYPDEHTGGRADEEVLHRHNWIFVHNSLSVMDGTPTDAQIEFWRQAYQRYGHENKYVHGLTRMLSLHDIEEAELYD